MSHTRESRFIIGHKHNLHQRFILRNFGGNICKNRHIFKDVKQSGVTALLNLLSIHPSGCFPSLRLIQLKLAVKPGRKRRQSYSNFTTASNKNLCPNNLTTFHNNDF